jgi:hypothetical protein
VWRVIGSPSGHHRVRVTRHLGLLADEGFVEVLDVMVMPSSAMATSG